MFLRFFLFSCLCLFTTSAFSKGLSYKEFVYLDSVVHIAYIDPNLYQVEISHSKLPFTVKTVSEIAKKENALSAINASFFSLNENSIGAPRGALKIAGELFCSTDRSRGAIGWSKGGKKAAIDRLDMKLYLLKGDEKLSLSGINYPRKAHEIMLYQGDFLLSPLARETGFEYPLGKSGILSTPEALSISSDFLENASLVARFFPLFAPGREEDWNLFENILGATPVLVFHGEKIRDFLPEKTLLDFLFLPKARSAVGLLPNGHFIFVMVEGSQSQRSKGVTMDQLANLMVTLGCESALNLDGGRSSTLYYKGNVFCSMQDFPEDSPLKERPVSNALLVKPI